MGVKDYPASTQLMTWLQGLSGFLTNTKNVYGSISEMLEHPDWDDSKTAIAIGMIGSLADNLKEAEKELTDHVSSKFG